MLAWMLAAHLAHADALSVQAVRVVPHGQEVPRLSVTAHESGSLRVTVVCGDRTWRVTRDVGPRSVVDVKLDGLAMGTYACEATLSFLSADGAEGDQTMSFEVASLDVVQLSSTLDDIDLVAGKALVRSSRPVDQARVTVFGARNVQLDQTMGEVVGNEIRFAFNPQGREVVKMVVEAQDAHGFASELELLPWSYAIPHEDLVFASGSHEIQEAELPKLHTAWAEVVRAVDLYGSVVKIQLYVAGYTDTVGDAGSNQGLSERRAKAIAQWFAGQGFPGTIHYQGFGESVLAVGTGDETDEVRNRRAVYVLAADVPKTGPDLPRAAWRRL